MRQGQAHRHIHSTGEWTPMAGVFVKRGLHVSLFFYKSQLGTLGLGRVVVYGLVGLRDGATNGTT